MEPNAETVELRPGMSHVVDAGEKLIITDAKGEELQIEGRDDPEVIAFIESFDSWLMVKEKNLDGPILDAAWNDVKVKFNALPGRIQNQLPSVKSLGIIIPGHSH